VDEGVDEKEDERAVIGGLEPEEALAIGGDENEVAALGETIEPGGELDELVGRDLQGTEQIGLKGHSGFRLEGESGARIHLR
jgi:hypothetical protein